MLTASGFHPLIPRGRILPDNSDSQRYRKESGHLGVWEQMLLQGGWPVTGLVSLAMERKGQDGVGGSNDLSSTNASWARASGPNSLRNSASHWPGLSLHISHATVQCVWCVCGRWGWGRGWCVCVYVWYMYVWGWLSKTWLLLTVHHRQEEQYLFSPPKSSYKVKKKSITPW